MKKTVLSNFRLALTLLVLILAGCGGEESYTSSNSLATVPFSGIVEDGPIAGAKISLRDTGGTYYPLYDSLGNANYEVKTDTAGAFVLAVKAETDFSNLSVFAVGGIDRDTGMDFSGLEMRSPLGLYQSDVTTIVVSPLTTLVAQLHDQGLSFEAAENRLRAWLALPADVNLAASPSTNLDLQRRTLLLSKIAQGIKTAPSYHLIAQEVVKANTSLLDEFGACNIDVLSALGFNAAETARVAKLQLLLIDPESVKTPDEAFVLFKREALIQIFDDNFQGMLNLPAPLAENYRKNLESLAKKTLLAAGSEIFLLAEPIPSRLFRYLFFTYLESQPESQDPLKKLSIGERLILNPADFESSLTYSPSDSVSPIALEADPWLALLARSSSANSADSPLLLNELPGDDNQKRMAYFYGLDISPHFQAERLIGKVFDDAVNDEVMVKVVEGKANAGLIDEARIIITTQIMQSESKANAYRTLADTLIRYNRREEARSALDLAKKLYRAVIAAKGVASASSTDVDNLVATSSSYRKAGDLENAELLLTQDIVAIATELSRDTTSYGKLITGIKNVVDDYLDAGDFAAAASLVETMNYYSDRTPQDKEKTTYKLRIYNWSECAKRYADLNNQAKVLEISTKVKMQRDADPATATGTWVYIPDLVESHYRVGATEEALALAATIPNDATNLAYLSKAYKLVATYEALQGNLQKAFEIVDNKSYITKDVERIELLTYFNDTRPYIAQMLIDEGRFSEARQALEKTEVVLASMTTSDNLVRISNGYVKVAALYALMGDKPKATSVLQSAEATIIEDLYRVRAMIDTALGYHNLDQTTVALNLLASAQSLAEADLTACYRADTTAKLGTAEAKTLLYEKLVLAYKQLGEKSRTFAALQLFLTSAQQIHPSGTVDDTLAGKECDYLLRGALYLDRADYHDEALNALTSARASSDQIAVPTKKLAKYLSIIATYAAVHEYDQGLTLALSLPTTTERNQAIQTLANAYIDQDDFPASDVASIDSDGDGRPDFFHPLASAEEIAASGLILDDDSDGDGVVDTLDFRPLFDDRPK